jgi:hypothetical protein
VELMGVRLCAVRNKVREHGLNQQFRQEWIQEWERNKIKRAPFSAPVRIYPV